MEFPQVRPEVDIEPPPNRFCDQVPVLKTDQPARAW
jgi:hypothetical protein